MTTENEGGKTPSSSPKDDTEKILQEMEDDGFDTQNPAPGGKQKPDKDDQDDEDESAKKDEADDEKDEDDGDDDIDEDADDEEDGDEGDDDDDIDEDEDSDDEDEPKSKKIMPLWKHKMILKKREKEIRQELGDMATRSQKGEEFDEDSDEIKGFVKEFGLDPNVGPKWVVRMLGLVEKRMSGKFQEIDKIRETVLDTQEERMFQKDMQRVMPLVRKALPDISDEQLDRVTGKLRELAYSDKYQHYDLEDIVRLNKKSLLGSDSGKERRKTGEHGKRAKASRGIKAYDLDNPDSIPFDELSDEEFEKVSNALAEKSPRHKITRRR